MNRIIIYLAISVLAMTGINSAFAQKHNTSKPLIDVVTAIVDTVSARRDMSNLDAARARQLEAYAKVREGLMNLPMHWGKKDLSFPELVALDSLIHFAPVKEMSTYNKIIKDQEKGKAHKSLSTVLDSYIAYLDNRVKMWTDTFINPSTAARVNVTRQIPNPFYLPAIINNPAMMDSIDYDSQLGAWKWIDTDPWIRVDNTYPRPFSYREYASHPDLRVIGDVIYDADGKVTALKRIARTGMELRPDGGTLYEQILDTLIRRDYMNNRYNILEEEDPVNPILRARLGIDNNPELASEPNKRVQAWIKQLTGDHSANLGAVYRIERIDDRTFGLTLLNQYGHARHRVIVEAVPAGLFDMTYKVVDIVPAAPVAVDMKYRAPETDRHEQTFYLLPEEPPTMENGGDEALAETLLKGIRVPSENLVDGLDHPVSMAIPVDRNGKVGEPILLRPCSQGLETVVRIALKNLRNLKPGRVDLHPVSSMRYITVVFNKNGLSVR